MVICAIVKNEACYLDEWVAYHLSVGISEFRIYNNQSTDQTSEVLTRLSRRAPVNWRDWADRHYWIHTQRLAYVDGAMYSAGRREFVAFIDVDEFLVSRADIPIAEHPILRLEGVEAVAVTQRVFGSSGTGMLCPRARHQPVQTSSARDV